MTFKVGQKVIVKPNLTLGGYYNECWLNPKMEKYLGKVATIIWKGSTPHSNRFRNIYNFTRYHLDIAGNDWVFSQEMLILYKDDIFISLNSLI